MWCLCPNKTGVDTTAGWLIVVVTNALGLVIIGTTNLVVSKGLTLVKNPLATLQEFY